MRIAFLTLGCKLNFAETSTYRRALLAENWEDVSWTSGKAEAFLVNTCSVTEHSDKKCRNIIRKLHRLNPSAPIVVTGAERMAVAQQILKALEANDIVGSAASVDVSRIDDIILWYGTRYQVNLGDNSGLDHKIACMNAVIAQMSEYQSGVLDCSFTIWPNQVGYTPFS